MILLQSDGNNIFKYSTETGGRVYLTEDVAGTANTLPSWSYDGSKIVYTRQAPGESAYIWTMDANGSNKRQLTFGSLSGNFVVFSPDGLQILFVGPTSGLPPRTPASPGNAAAELWLVNTDGSDPRSITDTTGSQISRTGIAIRWASNGFYSPDGSKIVYASTQSGRSQIWVMNADGTGQTQLTFPDDPNAPDANAPAWSPDGGKIVFWSGFVREYGNVYTINPDGSGRTQLTADSGTNSDNPVWSPNGTSIVFESGRGGALQTWIMNADGSDQRVLQSGDYGGGRMPLATGTLDDPGPAVVTGALCDPGTASTGMLSAQDAGFGFDDVTAFKPVTLLLQNDYNIFTITLDGDNKTYLTSDGNPDNINTLASWSADGSRIVYTNYKSTDPPTSGGLLLPTGHIWIMNADGSEQTQLTFDSIYGALPSFSPDGKSILFTGYATGTPELWLMNVDGTDPHQITHTTGSGVALDGIEVKWSSHGSFSPNGKKIAYSSTESGHAEIWVMNIDGSDKRQLTFPNDPNAPDANNPTWSPDSEKIVYFGGFERIGGYIFTINPDGTDRTQLTHIRGDDPSWSPDGQQIFFDVGRSDNLGAEAWIMNRDGSNQRPLLPTAVNPSRVPAITKLEVEFVSDDLGTAQPTGFDFQDITPPGSAAELLDLSVGLFDHSDTTEIANADRGIDLEFDQRWNDAGDIGGCEGGCW